MTLNFRENTGLYWTRAGPPDLCFQPPVSGNIMGLQSPANAQVSCVKRLTPKL
jgi:hypothetical protein